MNGKWTETNAIKVGYMAQYINSKSYSAATKYVYIHNGAIQCYVLIILILLEH